MLTEERNPRSRHIDQLETLEIIRIINQEDRLIAEAIGRVLPLIAETVDSITARLESNGRLFYVGAGTSGRLGVLDAVECPPTFGVRSELVQGILAGGYEASYSAIESAEDDPQQGLEDIRARGVTADDAVLGLSASGRTPYTVGALRFAQRLGAFTAGVSCNRASELSKVSDVGIEVIVGPEVVAGSTRMKAGTAQKMVLNMISTAVMIRLGNVYSNLMVNLKLSNRKLIERGVRIVAAAAGSTVNQARQALQEAGDVRSAIVMLQLECSPDEARGLISQSARVNEVIRDKRKTRQPG